MNVGYLIEFFDTGTALLRELHGETLPSRLAKVDKFEHSCHDGVALVYQSLPAIVERRTYSTIQYF
jgi:hypothetical protein